MHSRDSSAAVHDSRNLLLFVVSGRNLRLNDLNQQLHLQDMVIALCMVIHFFVTFEFPLACHNGFDALLQSHFCTILAQYNHRIFTGGPHLNQCLSPTLLVPKPQS